jgi:3-phosphoshikimate 1-carboxyvinyltransferase
MGELHRLVRELGADVHGEREGYLPVTIEGLGVSPSSGRSNLTRTLTARGDVSSQFISAIMMIAPVIGGVSIRLDGDVVSSDYLRMTARVMESFGVRVKFKSEVIEVPAASYRPMEFVVDADWSSASYAFAAVAIVGGSVRVARLHGPKPRRRQRRAGVEGSKPNSHGCRCRYVDDE